MNNHLIRSLCTALEAEIAVVYTAINTISLSAV